MKRSSYFQGTPVCLSSLLAAGRYQELLDLLEIAPFVCWADRAGALAAMGKSAEALRYAEASRGLNDHPDTIARACEAAIGGNAHSEAIDSNWSARSATMRVSRSIAIHLFGYCMLHLMSRGSEAGRLGWSNGQ